MLVGYKILHLILYALRYQAEDCLLYTSSSHCNIADILMPVLEQQGPTTRLAGIFLRYVVKQVV